LVKKINTIKGGCVGVQLQKQEYSRPKLPKVELSVSKYL